VSILLAIATATSQVGVALGGADGPMASLQVRRGRQHAEVLAPAIETISRLAGIGTQQISRVAVDIGPGLFTGLRVGVATAKALAAGLDVPIVGCSSLELLAYPHRRQAKTVASVIDAKRGEIFWALFRPGDEVDEGCRGRSPALCRLPRPVAGSRTGEPRRRSSRRGGPLGGGRHPALSATRGDHAALLAGRRRTYRLAATAPRSRPPCLTWRCAWSRCAGATCAPS
jgi:tRNA threonylcarbamoyl adenosine modification protein YeaZ